MNKVDLDALKGLTSPYRFESLRALWHLGTDADHRLALLAPDMCAELVERRARDAAMRDALREIAFIGTDVPAAAGGGDHEHFYRHQLYRCIGTAARALAALDGAKEGM